MNILTPRARRVSVCDDGVMSTDTVFASRTHLSKATGHSWSGWTVTTTLDVGRSSNP
jgi:hypothetical protein